MSAKLRFQTRGMGIVNATSGLAHVHLMRPHHRAHLRGEVMREPVGGHEVLTVAACIVKIMVIIGGVL